MNGNLRKLSWGCVALLAACSDRDPSTEGVAATLREPDHAGFMRAFAPRTFSFPADHGPHPDFREEWWYVTGNLDSRDGRRFGFQITFFRHGLKRGIPPRPSNWAFQDAYMAHFAVTDVNGRRHTSFQRIARGAVGLAGARDEPFKVWLDDWSMDAVSDSDFPWRIRARENGIALELEIKPLKPVVYHGEQGLSHKSAEPGNASYYYSISRLQAEGILRLAEQEIPVSGSAWLDREWSTSMLAPYQAGWDWFSLQLADGSDLMYFQIRHQDGGVDATSSGSLISTDGFVTHLTREDVEIQVRGNWDSPAGGRYPARWRLHVKPANRLLDIRPVLADQELRHDARYWEGAVDVTEAETDALAGRGYVELTGYASGQPRKSGD